MQHNISLLYLGEKMLDMCLCNKQCNIFNFISSNQIKKSKTFIDGDDVLRDDHGVHHDVLRDGDCDDGGDLHQRLLLR